MQNIPQTTSIEFRITGQSSYIETVYNAIGGEKVGEDTLFFEKNHPFLSGILKTYAITPGLRVSITKDFLVKKPLTMTRTSDPNNAFIIGRINLSDEFIPISDNIDFRVEEGIWINSSSEQMISNYPIGQIFTTVNFVFHKEWFKNYLQLEESSCLNQVLSKNHCFSIFEKMPTVILKIVKEIVQIDASNSFAKIALDNRITEVSSWILKTLEKCVSTDSGLNINKQDLENVVLIHQMLTKNLDKSLSINTLSREAGMSESKLKILFKQIYGMSIRQYIINYRMEKAYEMLSKEKRQIGEISAALGYANQSQFTQTFKEYFALLPTEVLKRVSK